MSLGWTLRRQILARDFNTCRYCGYSPPLEAEMNVEGIRTSSYTMHVDHVLPIVKGGTDDPENLVTACALCNLRKYDQIWTPCPLELM